MDIVRYIHAADLHLDTPFQGLAREAAQSGHLSRIMQDATFTALERLFRFCEEKRPDFLVLAGDIYNQENYSAKAQLALRDGCRRLDALGIRVFMAHGNHDPLSSRLTAIHWPENVTVFGPDVESRLVEKDGQPLALVHGISHAGSRENRNLAQLFRRDDTQSVFQLGVLHCTVEGEAKGDRYAPCSLDDLRRGRLDAWALGHIHQRRQWEDECFIAYSGNAQGLHINETGPRGCLLVTACPREGGWRCDSEFLRLGPVEWQKLELSLDAVDSLDALEDRLTRLLEESAGSLDGSCEALIARVTLTGRTPLDEQLRKAEACADIQERLLHLAANSPRIWLKDLIVETRPLLDEAEYRRREDLLGETMRLIDEMRRHPEQFAELGEAALAPLFSHARMRKALAPPDTEESRRLLDEAQRLCIDMLEVR